MEVCLKKKTLESLHSLKVLILLDVWRNLIQISVSLKWQIFLENLCPNLGLVSPRVLGGGFPSNQSIVENELCKRLWPFPLTIFKTPSVRLNNHFKNQAGNKTFSSWKEDISTTQQPQFFFFLAQGFGGYFLLLTYVLFCFFFSCSLKKFMLTKGFMRSDSFSFGSFLSMF